MSSLLPFAVAVPLVAAAVVAATGHVAPSRFADAGAITAAAATVAICTVLLVRSWDGVDVHWFGGWRPRADTAFGISFVSDPIGAGLALFAAIVVTAALVFSWHYFDEAAPLYHALVLVFLGATVGFSLTGDLFNLFVFFELMSVAAYALTAYAIDQVGPLQGALAFAVTNSVGGMLVLLGIALLYGRTGGLNLAQIGESLSRREPDGLVVVAFALLAAGFLVKAAVVPFHFWLADAYAVAPTPVCALLSSVMSELGLYALARVYWTVFSDPFAAHAEAIRDVLLGFAVATALVGGAMAFLQRHLKRMLAFVTIGHGGIFLAAIALLAPRSLAGVSLLVVADGLLKAALFLALGILIRRLRSGDELHLHGRCRRERLVGVVFLLGALGLAGMPPLATFLGKSWIEDASTTAGCAWLPAVLAVATILTAGSVLRATGRIFLGLGPKDDELLSPEGDAPEADEPHTRGRRTPLTMVAPVVVLLALGLGLALAPRLATRTVQAAALLEDRPAYAATVLRGKPSRPAPAQPQETPVSSYAYGAAATAGAVGLALLSLRRRREPRRALIRAIDGLKGLHSGHVGDYVAWLTVGTTVLGALVALAVR